MKKRKYSAVLLSVLAVLGILFLSEKIESKAYTVFMYISFALILIILFGYMVYLKISLLQKLTNKLQPLNFLADYAESDGNKYTPERYMYEALAHILTENFAAADASLNGVFQCKNTHQILITSDAINILNQYFQSDEEKLRLAVDKFNKDYAVLNKKEQTDFVYLLNFKNLIYSLKFEPSMPKNISETYFNSIKKKNFLEVYTASLLIGEAELKIGNKEKAKTMFVNACNAPSDTILYKRAAHFISLCDNED